MYNVYEPKYRAVEFSGDFTFKFYYGKRMLQKTVRLIATTDENASSDEYDDDTLLCKIDCDATEKQA